MKLNENFLIHDTGSEICHLLENNDLSLDELLNHFYNEYPEEDKSLIKQSVIDFVNQLKKINAIKD